MDQVAHALERLQTFLTWIDEHHRSFEKVRDTDPQSAASELHNLRDSTEQAVLHLQRLTELLLGGYSIEPDMAPPKGLCNETWTRWVQLILHDREKLQRGL
jgi:hypothetical protein